MSKLSESEKVCWTYIEENIDIIQNLTMAEVAKKSYTSLATVGRTIKKMGYASYFELKIASKNMKNRHSQSIPSFSPEVSSLIEGSKEEFFQTVDQLSVKTLEKAVDLLSNAKVISIFASGASLLVAKDAQNKLQFLEKQVNIYANSESMTYYSKRLPQDSLVLCVSLSGETPEIVSSFKTVKSHQIKILTLTAAPQSTLAIMADACLIGYCFKRKEINLGLDMDSRLCLSFLVRLLVDCLTVKKNFGKIGN